MGSEIGLRLRHMKGAGAESNGYGYGHVATGEYTTFNMKRRGLLRLIWLLRIIELRHIVIPMTVQLQVVLEVD